MEERYATDCLGWLLVRVLRRQGMTADRLAQHLDLTPAALAVLARCRVPPVRSVGFERRLDALATTFRVPRWRLTFICQEAGRATPRP